MYHIIKGIFQKGALKIFGSRNQRIIDSTMPLVKRVGEAEPEIQKLSDAQLLKKTEEFRNRISDGESPDNLLVEVFACVRESARRNTPENMRPFDVQVLGGIILHAGMITEMATGEGKTLVATMPLFLNALTGRSHLITVNDYLARRDRDWMGPIYEGLGMSVGVIQTEMMPPERKAQYACDIIYGTNSEFGFDYLRDNMKMNPEDQAQGSLDYAIVDEVDSVLIDEARTPLIISGPSEEKSDKYRTANLVAKRLKKGDHFEVKEKEHQVVLTEEGIEKAQEIVGVDSFYTTANMDWPHFIDNALRAHHLFHNDVEYIVKEGNVIIVDEFTGRLMPGRRWSDGLHQAVETKEGIKVEGENQTLATITIQNYFRMYKKLAGMTGTAMTEAGEFDNIYKMETVAIPTNEPCVRVDSPDIIYATEKEKYSAIGDEIERLHKAGQPILIGTSSIENNERLAKILEVRGIKHEILNAKNHAREAAIITQAGQKSAVTLATNMAGRGTDIKLGEGVRDIGGLAVVGTERHDARRIDNQLRGRSGRQGDSGASQFFISMEDTLMRRFGGDWAKKWMQRFGMRDGQDITSPILSRQIARAQKRVEEQNFSIRKSLLEYDEVMDAQRKRIYAIRQQVLESKDLKKTILDMVRERICHAIDYLYLPDGADKDSWDYEGLAEWFHTTFTVKPDVEKIRRIPVDDLDKYLSEKMERAYEERETVEGAERMRAIERRILLDTIDRRWKDHLYAMDYLRSAVSWSGYAQKDPKVVYKIEGMEMFNKMMDSIRENITMVFRLTLTEQEPERDYWGGAEIRHDSFDPEAESAIQQQMAAGIAASQRAEKLKPIVKKTEKVGRNDPCPCGSGKKYKKCCGRNA